MYQDFLKEIDLGIDDVSIEAVLSRFAVESVLKQFYSDLKDPSSLTCINLHPFLLEPGLRSGTKWGQAVHFVQAYLACFLQLNADGSIGVIQISKNQDHNQLLRDYLPWHLNINSPERIAKSSLQWISGIADSIMIALFRHPEEFAGLYNKVNTPAKTRLELAEGRKQLRIDDAWIDYRGDNATFFLEMLIKARGKWESGTNLVSNCRSRADRVRKSLPASIQSIIDKPRRGGTGGYRIYPEYFTPGI